MLYYGGDVEKQILFYGFPIQRFLRGLKVAIIGKRNELMDDAIFEKDRWNSLLVCLNGF